MKKRPTMPTATFVRTVNALGRYGDSRGGLGLTLLARQHVRREWRLLRRDVTDQAVAALVDQYRDEIDAYWHRVLDLGRPPTPEEYPDGHTLVQLGGSWWRVHEWVFSFFDSEELKAAAIGRQEELLVHSHTPTSRRTPTTTCSLHTDS